MSKPSQTNNKSNTESYDPEDPFGLHKAAIAKLSNLTSGAPAKNVQPIATVVRSDVSSEKDNNWKEPTDDRFGLWEKLVGSKLRGNSK